MTPLLIHGMHGLGDNIQQRAIVKALMPTHDICLETSWPCIYADLPVRCIRRPVALRTQLKNSQREAVKFVIAAPSHHSQNSIRVSYSRANIGNGTIMEAMFKVAGIPQHYPQADYRLSVPAEWSDDRVKVIIELAGNKPILIYRPLTARPEWRGGQVRNANAEDYAELFTQIRDAFFVVSLADLEPGREWIVGPRLRPDVTLHRGELHFEQMAALFKHANIVYTSSGFASILAPAVGTACISVQGGYEPAQWHADGARFAPWLGIDTVKPCNCGTSACSAPCQKRLDLPKAKALVRGFCSISSNAETRPASEMFDPPEQVDTVHVRRPPITLRQVNPMLAKRNPLQQRRPAMKA